MQISIEHRNGATFATIKEGNSDLTVKLDDHVTYEEALRKLSDEYQAKAERFARYARLCDGAANLESGN